MNTLGHVAAFFLFFGSNCSECQFIGVFTEGKKRSIHIFQRTRCTQQCVVVCQRGQFTDLQLGKSHSSNSVFLIPCRIAPRSAFIFIQYTQNDNGCELFPVLLNRLSGLLLVPHLMSGIVSVSCDLHQHRQSSRFPFGFGAYHQEQSLTVRASLLSDPELQMYFAFFLGERHYQFVLFLFQNLG